MVDINVNKLSEALNGKADIDLNNTGVFSTNVGGGVNLSVSTPAGAEYKEVVSADYVGNKFSQVATNCITEIPQDIKLELNDGVLTLKAGSKLWYPDGLNEDGSKKFTSVTTDVDKTFAPTITSNWLIYVRFDGVLIGEGDMTCFSGDSAPSGFTDYVTWYDTASNYIKRSNDGTTWNVMGSFPIARVQVYNNKAQSIDQVFNGFGYIGSTVFALPGIKGLIPNGRNVDGSLRNLPFTLENLVTYTTAPSEAGELMLTATGEFMWIASSRQYYEQYQLPFTPAQNVYGTWYNPEDNVIRISWNNQEWHQELWFHVAGVNGEVSKFTALRPKQAFRSLDYYDRPQLSGIGMPSNKFVDLTLGATGTQYIAPANGWFYFRRASDGSLTSLSLRNETKDYMCEVSQTVANPAIILPVNKGDKCSVWWLNGATQNWLRFYYADGEV